LQDETGTIQLYLDKKRIQSGMADGDPDAFNHLKQLTDVGTSWESKGQSNGREGRAICLRAAVRHSYQISSTLTG